MTSYRLEEIAIVPVHLVIILACWVGAACLIARALEQSRALANRRLAEITAEAAAVGVSVLPGSSLGKLVASTTVDGVAVSIEPHIVQEYDHSNGRFHNAPRALIRSLSPCRWSDAVLLTSVPEHFGLGRLTEVHSGPLSGYRAFFQSPAEAQQWLRVETCFTMRQLASESLTVHSRQISLVLKSPWLGASEMLNGAHVIASIFHGRPMHAPISVRSAPCGPIYGPILRMLAAIALGAMAGLAAPAMPFLLPLFTPITCPEGDLETTGYSNRKHELIAFRCVGGAGAVYGAAAAMTTYPSIASVAGLVTFAAASAAASAIRRRD